MADLTGGDLFEADTVKLYEADYYACIGEAKRNCGKAQGRRAAFLFMELKQQIPAVK